MAPGTNLELIRDAFKTMTWDVKKQRQTLQGPEVPKKAIEEFVEVRHALQASAQTAQEIKAKNEALASRRPFGEG